MGRCSIVKYSLQAIVNTSPLDADASFESREGDEFHIHQTLFEDHRKGKDVLLNPRSILRMCLEKAKAAYSKLRFESKAKS